MTTKQNFEWPIITKDTKQAVVNQLGKSISIYDRSGIIEEFENKFAKYHNNSRYALLTNSGTNALLSIYIGAQLREGDEVICPVYTFFATVTPIFFTGAVPIFCDIDEYGNIDPEDIERKITSKTKAIMVTHMWGNPCKMDEISIIAKKYDLLLFEDCSHAHGSLYKNKVVGTFGDVAAWSLQGPKTISGGEGGILVTNNEEIYYRALLLGHYNKRCKQEIPTQHILSKYSTTGMGLKLRSHPLAVAIANQQFSNLEKILVNRRKNAKILIDNINSIQGLKVIADLSKCNPNWYAMIILFDADNFLVSRESFVKELINKGCTYVDIPNSTSPLNLLPLFQEPELLFPSYKGKIYYTADDFPRAVAFYKKIIKIPIFTDNGRIARRFSKVLKNISEKFAR